MRRTPGVGVVLLLASLLALTGAGAWQPDGDEARSRLQPQYSGAPDPIRIPFEVHESDLPEGRPAVVTIRIRNPLGEVVGVPRAASHPDGGGAEVVNLRYSTAGLHEAYWDGVGLRGGRVASGLYYLEVIVNGERAPLRTIFLAK